MSDSDAGKALEVLDGEECYRLLGTQDLGRLGVNAEHYPLIFPVNYALDHGTVVFRTSPGTKLASLNHANVTFEVDSIDRASRTGWSVLVRGLAEEVGTKHDAALVQRTIDSNVTPWAPGEREHWVRIIPHKVTGRRIVLGEQSPSLGYL